MLLGDGWYVTRVLIRVSTLGVRSMRVFVFDFTCIEPCAYQHGGTDGAPDAPCECERRIPRCRYSKRPVGYGGRRDTGPTDLAFRVRPTIEDLAIAWKIGRMSMIRAESVRRGACSGSQARGLCVLHIQGSGSNMWQNSLDKCYRIPAITMENYGFLGCALCL